MTGGTGYALAALVCYGVGDFIYKRATAEGVKPHHFLMGQAWCFSPAIVLYGLATGTLVLRTSAVWNGLAGLFMFIGLFNFLRSLASGPVSIAAPIFRLNFVVTSVLAILVLGEPLTLESVAAEAHMSSRTLARRFRAETGDSVLDWIALRRVELARGLLEDSAMTISQIAYTAGFGSTESLRRHFRAATGTSPRDYRQTFNAKADAAPLPAPPPPAADCCSYILCMSVVDACSRACVLRSMSSLSSLAMAVLTAAIAYAPVACA